MDIKKVRELVKLVEESGIEELEVSNNETTIRIQKSALAAPAMAGMPAYAPVPPTLPAASAESEHLETQPVGESDPVRAKWKDIRSPIVGTLYRAPSPAADAFVQVGDHVVKGQTLCIVEAMKVMNEIEAEFAGTIREILAENGGPVEAEAVLFLIEPD